MLVPLNLACIILSLNSYDYGGVGGVGCGYNNCDDDDDDVGDYDDDAVDDNYDYDHHDHDDGDGNFWGNQSFWYAMFCQLNYLFPLFISDEMYWYSILT